MKLRLRSLESKVTLKIEVSNSCSLQELKETLSRAISTPSSSLHLSLNRKDELYAPCPDESLHSIGITTGGLIFYTLNPNGFSLETLEHKSGPLQIQPTDPTIQESNSHEELPEGFQNYQSFETQNQNSTGGQAEAVEIIMNDALPEEREKEGFCEAESTEMIDGSVEVVVKSNTEPSFVKRVLKEAPGDDFSDHKLLVAAVHAVILESGLVRLNQVSGMAVGCSHLLDEWPSAASTISLRYTLPEILTNGSGRTEAVVLKFQTMGNFVNVYGSLSVSGSGLHRICLDKCKFAKALEIMLAKSELKDSTNNGEENRDNEVFQLWKMVKDGLALPLLIDLCEKTGLGSPPCFMRLPTELKLKILEYLPGVDVAKVSCLCSEMRYLSSSNDLWKLKFEEEFGHGRAERGMSSFKDLFAQYWDTRKRSEIAVPIRSFQCHCLGCFVMKRKPNPFGKPSIMGGDYGRLPGFGVPSPFRQSGFPFRAFQPRRTCYLGGFNMWNLNYEPCLCQWCSGQ